MVGPGIFVVSLIQNLFCVTSRESKDPTSNQQYTGLGRREHECREWEFSRNIIVRIKQVSQSAFWEERVVSCLKFMPCESWSSVPTFLVYIKPGSWFRDHVRFGFGPGEWRDGSATEIEFGILIGKPVSCKNHMLYVSSSGCHGCPKKFQSLVQLWCQEGWPHFPGTQVSAGISSANGMRGVRDERPEYSVGFGRPGRGLLEETLGHHVCFP